MAFKEDGRIPERPMLRNAAFARIPASRELARLESLRSKLVEPERRARDKVKIDRPDYSMVSGITNQSAQDVRDADDIMQLLPELELVEEILVSSILSPKDMMSDELHYSVNSDIYTSDIINRFLEIIRDHFNKTGMLKDMLPDVLSDALFRKGSYPVAIIPESSVDEAINSRCVFGMESLGVEWDSHRNQLRTTGFLGNPKKETPSLKMGLEQYLMPHFETYRDTDVKGLKVSIVDNPNILKIPMLKEKIREDSFRRVMHNSGYASESLATDNAYGVGQQSFYRKRTYQYTPVLSIKTKDQVDRKTVGHPLIMKLPHESIIVIHRPGNPKDHVAYFVALDEAGNPINTTQYRDYYQEMYQAANNGGMSGLSAANYQAMSRDIKQLYGNMFGLQGMDDNKRVELDRLYADIMEKELMTRVQNGVVGSDAEMQKDMAIFQAMLARAAKGKRSQLLFIPASLMVYFAFDYNEYGIGRSLIAKSKIIAGLRAMLMFADTQGAMANSIPMRRIKIGLDEQDPDPSGTVNDLLHEYYRVNAYRFPLGEPNPGIMLDYLQRASTSVEVSGNSGYPTTTFDVDDTTTSKARPDSDLTESLKKRHIQAFGLSPETVDAAQGADFATTVVQNNLLLSKRIANYHRLLAPLLKKFVKTYVVNSQELMDEMRQCLRESFHQLTVDEKEAVEEGEAQRKVAIAASAKLGEPRMVQGQPVVVKNPERVETNKEKVLTGKLKALDAIIKESGYDALILDFLESLEVTLPDPDGLETSIKSEMIESYEQALNKTLDAIISDTFITSDSVGDEISSALPMVKEALKSHYLRQFIQKNGIMPELMELTSWDAEDGPAMELLKQTQNHNDAIAKSILSYALAIKSAIDKRGAAAKLMGESEGGGSDYGSSDSGSDVSGGDSGGDDFGGDDFGGDDFGGDGDGDAGGEGAEDAGDAGDEGGDEAF